MAPKVATALEAGSIADGWTLVIEVNGYRSTDTTKLRTLSQHGQAVVVYDNVNALTTFQYAKDGQLVRQFDPLLYGIELDIGPKLLQETGISFGAKDDLNPIAQSLLLTQLLTGVTLTAAEVDDSAGRIAVGILN